MYSRNGLFLSTPYSRSCRRAIAIATNAPVTDAVRVPPSAWMTSQSMITVRSPSALISTAARSDQGPPLGAHARDPTSDRALHARGGGYERAGRTHGDHRLRCHPGGWRYAHGVGHRSIRGDGDGPAATARVRSTQEQPIARIHRGHQRGSSGRGADARPLLRRGFAGRRGYERGDDRRRPVRRSAGHGGAHAVQRRADGSNDGSGAHGHHGTGDHAEGDHRSLTRLYCATGNAGKLREFRMAADSARIEIELLPGYRELPAAVEDGATFEENAIKKALHYGPHAAGLLFADDSGLEVEALGGAPGVYSARFSGPHATDDSNNRLLLEKLHGVANRKARFVCKIALVEGERVVGVYHGAVEGTILDEPRGFGGFGYDPLFYCPAFGCTFGEAAGERKFSLSHRGQAVRAMLARL